MLYRKKYLIGIYEPISRGETLIGLCQNIREFAEFMGIKYDNAAQILHLLFTKQTNYIRFKGMICTVAFILDTDDDKTYEEKEL